MSVDLLAGLVTLINATQGNRGIQGEMFRRGKPEKVGLNSVGLLLRRTTYTSCVLGEFCYSEVSLTIDAHSRLRQNSISMPCLRMLHCRYA